MQNRELNFRVFAREACPIIDVPAGETVFHMGEPGATLIQTSRTGFAARPAPCSPLSSIGLRKIQRPTMTPITFGADRYFSSI